jgi:ribosomal protein L11 methyltransferase
MNIYEVSVKVDSANIGRIEILKELLINTGIERHQIVECTQWPHNYLIVHFSTLGEARTFKKKLSAFHLNDVTIAIKRLLKRDWLTKWKSEFKPFFLTKNFGVVPMRLKGKYAFRKHKPIYIDTDIAFGTGLHATTRFMAQLVERCQGRFESFLDVGTGTGILAMVASKCDARDVTAIDISPETIKVARSNFNENECLSIKIKTADVHKIKFKRQYDLVCANIITQDLIRMADKLCSLVKPGKYLAVSGISANSYDALRNAYAPYPLRCVKVTKGEDWMAILFKKYHENLNSIVIP